MLASTEQKTLNCEILKFHLQLLATNGKILFNTCVQN